ncbi:putative glycoside hydrolase family 72 protein [Erysiphe necator]|uniref:1,3-beta-glucanosyltransferase n=1 Tax=Uncinula necator TaxID=52586 RepID=A0A0B1NZE4_UNCNE|nr:putative glycoside hydrolase family 72 protein [Erysiphe necator]
MIFKCEIASLIILLVFFTEYGLAVAPISIQDQKFVDSVTGNEFKIVGVAYQPGGSSGYNPGSGVDPLSDGDICLRDAALMQQLGVNALRVYNVDPAINHDMCASIFNEVGIYLLIDVNSPLNGESLNRKAPGSSYNVGYLQRTFAVVESFKNYPNTLLFFSGNEVINDVPTAANVPPYLRAVTRDIKNYIAKNSKRKIPVGYSAADVREILVDTFNYLQCSMTGDDTDPSRGDFFALNSYSWCGNSSFTKAGYDVLISDFKESSVPVFFSEYGCNAVSPRVFTEVPALYGPLAAPVLCGGVVYEYSQEPSNYGLVELNSDGSAKLKLDYESLQTQISGLDSKALQGTKARRGNSVSIPKCSSSLIGTSVFYNEFDMLDVPQGVQELIDNGIPNAPSGKLVSVTKTKITNSVQRSNGDLIQGLEIHPIAPSTGDYRNGTKSPGIANPTAGSPVSPIPSGKFTSVGASMPTSSPSSTPDAPKSGAGIFRKNGLIMNLMYGVMPLVAFAFF